ncbi:MAG: peptidase domain-containing ABC transporter, partial [Proteobacteria bacterium]|nr:peptidase domain-containing ABC transporter [Pseudomonadota bacterium]
MRCLAAVARHHGVDLSVDALTHQYGIAETEPTTALLLKIADGAGFSAQALHLDWGDLVRLDQALPALARLRNGNTVILSGIRGGPSGQEAVVLDPLATKPGFLFLSRESFATSWTGETILLKRSYRLTDPDQPFGLRWFVPELLRQRRVFAEVAIAVIVLHLVALAVPIFFQIVIDKVLVHQNYSTLYVLAIGVSLAVLFDAILTYVRGDLLLHATAKIDMRVSSRTFAHLLTLPLAFFEHAAAGVLTKHMQQSGTVRQFLTGRLFLTLLDGLALLVFVPVLIFYSPPLTALVLAFAAVLGLLLFALMGPFRRRLRALYDAEGERQAHLVEAIHGIQTVKSLALEPQQRHDWDRKAANVVLRNVDLGRISVLARAMSGLLEKGMVIAVVAAGAYLVFGGALSVGALVAFQMLAGRISGPLVQIISLIHEYQEAALSIRMLGEVMNRRGETRAREGLTPPIAGRIEFEGVTFRYGDNPAPALQELNLTVPAGSLLGVVGRSGSGKTTLTRLIQGLYPLQMGTLRIDGFDVRDFDLAHLRSHIGVVLQDSFMFRGTVRDNIALTKPGAALEDVIAAARLAGAAEFIERLPKGYDTVIEEGGANLSGGQRQRIAIARALLRKPP